MNQQASITDLMAAFGRAFHAENARDPIFADTKVRELMTDEEYAAIGKAILDGRTFFAPEKTGTWTDDRDALRDLVNTQIAPTPLARARFCEDGLKVAVQTGTRQYVILGAGLDTFAFREPAFTAKYPVFEVDHPLTQADKCRRIRRAQWPCTKNLHFVAADLTKDDWTDKLTEAGFDPAKKTFFAWLGVCYYLSVGQIELLLDRLADLSADGSSLLFDYAGEGLFSSPIRRVQNMVAMAAAGGEPMRSCFGYAALERLLEGHQYRLYEWMTPRAIQARYFDGRDDGLTAFEHIHFALAVRKREPNPAAASVSERKHHGSDGAH